MRIDCIQTSMANARTITGERVIQKLLDSTRVIVAKFYLSDKYFTLATYAQEPAPQEFAKAKNRYRRALG